MDHYRFDDAYSKVYIYDVECHGFIFCCSYVAAGIKVEMSEHEKIKQFEDFYYGGIKNGKA